MKKTTYKVNIECDTSTEVEVEKVVTGKVIYEAAFDSACVEYHEYTVDYITDYASNAFGIELVNSEAQAILDVVESIKHLKESGQLNSLEYSYLTQTLEFTV